MNRTTARPPALRNAGFRCMKRRQVARKEPSWKVEAHSGSPPVPVVAAASVKEAKKGWMESWEGAKIVPMIASIAVGLALYLFCPVPPGVDPRAWKLLSIFLSTVTGLVLGPLPVGAWAFAGLTVAVATRTLSFAEAFGAFSNEVIWLIVISFFFARGFIQTGLGERVATLFVKLYGKSTMGLAYGLTFAEAIISPAMPSSTARAGGVFLPIISSLSLSNGSKPNDPSSTKMGAYLVQTQLQAANASSNLFLTGSAQNLLCLKLAQELGVVVPNAWMTWLVGSIVPTFISLALTPFVLYKIFPPEITETPEAPKAAEKRLQEMGPMSTNEKIMLATMVLAVGLWMFGDMVGISAVVAAMLGLCTLLLTGVLKWKDCLNETSAWDTLVWFAVLIGMSSQLKQMGLVGFLSDSVAQALTSLSLSWPVVYVGLNVVFFYIHYLFASQTAHVGALYAAFTAMALAAGVPGILAALSLAYTSNLFGAITHYASGQSAVFFGAGYQELPSYFRVGFLMSIFYMVVWMTTGTAWWKIVGFF